MKLCVELRNRVNSDLMRGAGKKGKRFIDDRPMKQDNILKLILKFG